MSYELGVMSLVQKSDGLFLLGLERRQGLLSLKPYVTLNLSKKPTGIRMG